MWGVDVALEVGTRRVFATALDWPGWCRSGKGAEAALAALADAAPRYALVAAAAKIAFRPGLADDLTVVERLPGDGSTDFGAPGQVAKRDREPLTAAQARRRAALLQAAWVVFDRVVAAAPAELRKGPRGGGRDRDKIVEHVLGAESGYARKLGLKFPAATDLAGAVGPRELIADALRGASDGSPLAPRGWPPRYAAARVAWHALDHAWEIEDRAGG
jgi:hypothetical protein